jgi:hypothetical protein
MEERTYRILLVVLTGLVILNLATIGFGLFRETGEEDTYDYQPIARLIGYGLLPVAMIGLWSWKPWAFWVLGLATVTTLAADLPEGLFAGFWRSFPHLTTIVMTVEQYLTRKEEKEAEEQANSQGPHAP